MLAGTSVEEVRRNAAGIAANGVGDLVCRYPKVTVRVLSRAAAYSLAYSYIDVTTSAGRMQVHTSVTNIWCRVDGEWACVHEHSSLPVDITSGKAKLTQSI